MTPFTLVQRLPAPSAPRRRHHHRATPRHRSGPSPATQPRRKRPAHPTRRPRRRAALRAPQRLRIHQPSLGRHAVSRTGPQHRSPPTTAQPARLCSRCQLPRPIPGTRPSPCPSSGVTFSPKSGPYGGPRGRSGPRLEQRQRTPTDALASPEDRGQRTAISRFSATISTTPAQVAQRREQPPPKRQVVGSIPTLGAAHRCRRAEPGSVVSAVPDPARGRERASVVVPRRRWSAQLVSTLGRGNPWASHSR